MEEDDTFPAIKASTTKQQKNYPLVAKFITEKKISANVIKKTTGISWGQKPTFSVTNLERRTFFCAILIQRRKERRLLRKVHGRLKSRF